jgi:hypothetical protein
MNLNAIVAPLIGAVNPNQPAQIRVSIGQDASGNPAYATPGSLTASIGAVFTASVAGTTMTVTGVASGIISANDALSGTDGAGNALPAGAYVYEQLTGSPAGGVGTYELGGVTDSQVLESTTVTGASTLLNITAVTKGVPQPGQTLADAGPVLLAGTMITGQLSGPQGGVGAYSLSQQQTVAPEAMTTSMTLYVQEQALTGGDLRHMDALNLQGSHRALYVNNNIRGAVRVALKGGDIVTLANGSVWLVTQVLEPFFDSAGWQKCVITEQDGS